MTVFVFDDFTFDPRALTLRRGDDSAPLKPQSAEFLSTLLHAAPDFVSREDLIARLWPDGRVVEFDQGLNTCARDVRRALGETADNVRYVETLPKRGYRFCADVQRTANGAASPSFTGRDSAPDQSRPPVRSPISRQVSRRVMMVVAVIAVVGALAAFASLGPHRRSSNQSEQAGSALSADRAELLVRARHGLDVGDVAALEASRVAYAELAAADPGFAEARGGYALATALAAGQNGHPWAAWTSEAEKVAREVIAAAPDQAHALTALGYVALYRDWDLAQAVRLLDRSIAAPQPRADALALRGAAAAALGDVEGAARYADQAALAEPVAMSVRADRCWLRLYARDYDAAIAACEWALLQDPDHQWTRLGLATALHRAGRAEEAVASLADMGATDVAILGVGPAPSADDIWRRTMCQLADAQARQSSALRSEVLVAGFEAECGRVDDALLALTAGLAARESGMLFVAVDPRFDALRSRADFAELTRSVQAAAVAE